MLRNTKHRWLILCLLLAATCTASAQMLARPGWNGSGFNADPWWKHAIFYQPAAADLKSVTSQLDSLQSLGADALILPTPALPAASSTEIDTNFDDLISESGRRGIRILLTLSAPTANTDLAPTARYWLSRGVSGFYIQTPPEISPQDRQTIVQSIRKITSSTVGSRIVISDFSPDAGSAAATPQLQVDARWSQLNLPTASSLRPQLTQSLTAPNILLNFHPPTPADSAFANAVATIQLAIHSAALMPNAASPQTTDWVRQLAALHHDNAALRYGNLTFLDFDAQNTLVWVSRPASASSLTAPVVVACNLSSAPVKLSLTAAIKTLGLHGWFLRTLLRTDQAMGAQNLDSVTVPPYGVYIGELHR